MSEEMEWLGETLSEILDIDISRVTANANLIDDLGADSLDFTELVYDIEDKFQVELPDYEDDLDSLKTVQDWHNYIRRARAGEFDG